MRSWLRHSFKNRIFVTVLLVTLLPLLFCDVLVMQVQRARSESSLAAQAQAQLTGWNRLWTPPASPTARRPNGSAAAQ